MSTDEVRVAETHRREIDLAVGVLVGLCGLDVDRAFGELAAHARSTGTGLVPTARAVVALAQGRPVDTPARRGAELRWGAALDGRTAPSSAA